jgi:hypothetical protein
MNMVMGVFVRMAVLMGVRMHDTIGVAMLVSVYVRVDVRVRVVVFDWTRHDIFLLVKTGGELSASNVAGQSPRPILCRMANETQERRRFKAMLSSRQSCCREIAVMRSCPTSVSTAIGSYIPTEPVMNTATGLA